MSVMVDDITVTVPITDCDPTPYPRAWRRSHGGRRVQGHRLDCGFDVWQEYPKAAIAAGGSVGSALNGYNHPAVRPDDAFGFIYTRLLPELRSLGTVTGPPRLSRLDSATDLFCNRADVPSLLRALETVPVTPKGGETISKALYRTGGRRTLEVRNKSRSFDVRAYDIPPEAFANYSPDDEIDVDGPVDIDPAEEEARSIADTDYGFDLFTPDRGDDDVSYDHVVRFEAEHHVDRLSGFGLRDIDAVNSDDFADILEKMHRGSITRAGMVGIVTSQQTWRHQAARYLRHQGHSTREILMFIGWRQTVLDGIFDDHAVSSPKLTQYRRWESEMGLHPALDDWGWGVEYTLDHEGGCIRRKEITLEYLQA